MDDATLGGDSDVLVTDFNTVGRVGQAIGIGLNEQKCELTSDDNIVDKFRAAVPAIIHIGATWLR